MRVPVDRAFTLRGFGTVVTGTVISGSLSLGDEVEVLPGGRRARVRGLHVHNQVQEHVGAGHRVAVNLAGIETGEVGRGLLLSSPGQLRATSLLDAVVTLMPEATARSRTGRGCGCTWRAPRSWRGCGCWTARRCGPKRPLSRSSGWSSRSSRAARTGS